MRGNGDGKTVLESPADQIAGASILPANASTPSRAARWRNAVLATVLILAGVTSALVTILARQTSNYALAAGAAIMSLVIALLMLIFIVPRLARSARMEVTRLDLPIEITAGGAIFLLILFVVGFAAWNTGNNLLFLVFSLLLSTLFVSGAAARASLRDLIVSARFPDHIFAGDPAPVIVTLKNAKRLLPSFSVSVASRGPSQLATPGRKRKARYTKRLLAYFTYVPHKASAEQRVEQTFTHRGHVLITGFELSTLFPFGFFRFRRKLRARDVDIVVYPKPEAISDELHLLPTFAGQMISPRRGIGQDLFSLRDYQPQDDLRHIDWKATARSRHLTVREFTAEDERRITIILDVAAPNDAAIDAFSERFERGVIQTASLLKHFIRERAEVRLMIEDELGPYGTGINHLYGCLRRLAVVSLRTSNREQLSNSFTKVSQRQKIWSQDYAIIVTGADPGSIPAHIWRASFVIHV